MDIINYEDLVFPPGPFYDGKGSFGKINKCWLNNDTYAYKEFHNPGFLTSKIRKINLIGKIDEPFIVVPKFFVEKKGTKSGYLTRFVNGKDLISQNEATGIEERIKLLRMAKQQIQAMHQKYNLIHGNISGCNIMIEKMNTVFIDFDNSTYAGYKTNSNDANDLAIDFIKAYGICKELDIFLLNILTFEIINNVGRALVRAEINAHRFGAFTSTDSRRILASTLLCEKYPTSDFLIDTIDETTIKK